jgi:hypothetical protein
MSGNNFPPGVTGREPQINGDQAWEEFHDRLDDDINSEGMSMEDAIIAWKLGMQIWHKIHLLGGKFPHECGPCDT